MHNQGRDYSEMNSPSGFFEPEDKDSDHHIVLEDPYNLSIPTLYIRDRILAEQKLAQADGVPLVIIMGEIHDISAYSALQGGVAASLIPDVKSARSYIVADELDWDWLDKRYPHYSAEKGRFDQRYYAANFSSLADSFHVAATKMWKQSYLLKNRVPCINVDAACEYLDTMPYISDQDRRAQKIYTQITKKKFERYELDALDANGFKIRNLIMVEHIKEAFANASVKAALLCVGNMHVLGGYDLEDGEVYSYKESLAALFKQSGYRVLPILPGYDLMTDVWWTGENYLEQALLENPETILIEGMPCDDFCYPQRGTIVSEEESYSTILKQEFEHLETLLQGFKTLENEHIVLPPLPKILRDQDYYKLAEEVLARILRNGVSDEELDDIYQQFWQGEMPTQSTLNFDRE